MVNKELEKLLKGLDYAELTEVQKKIRLLKSNRTPQRGKLFGAYLPLRYVPAQKLVLDYLYAKGVTPSKTMYATGTVAISALFEQTLTELEDLKRKEEERKQRLLGKYAKSPGAPSSGH